MRIVNFEVRHHSVNDCRANDVASDAEFEANLYLSLKHWIVFRRVALEVEHDGFLEVEDREVGVVHFSDLVEVVDVKRRGGAVSGVGIREVKAPNQCVDVEHITPSVGNPTSRFVRRRYTGRTGSTKIQKTNGASLIFYSEDTAAKISELSRQSP